MTERETVGPVFTEGSAAFRAGPVARDEERGLPVHALLDGAPHTGNDVGWPARPDYPRWARRHASGTADRGLACADDRVLVLPRCCPSASIAAIPQAGVVLSRLAKATACGLALTRRTR
jgi:hypothetical protein